MTFFNFTKNIYLNHRPVLVDDATDTWPAMKKFTVKKLFQVKIHRREREWISIDWFSCSWKIPFSRSMISVISKLIFDNTINQVEPISYSMIISKENVDHLSHIGNENLCFYWEKFDDIFRNNCKRETLKILRSYYNKPYFLPPSVGQTLMGNWFLVSAGFEKDTKRSHHVSAKDWWRRSHDRSLLIRFLWILIGFG